MDFRSEIEYKSGFELYENLPEKTTAAQYLYNKMKEYWQDRFVRQLNSTGAVYTLLNTNEDEILAFFDQLIVNDAEFSLYNQDLHNYIYENAEIYCSYEPIE